MKVGNTQQVGTFIRIDFSDVPQRLTETSLTLRKCYLYGIRSFNSTTGIPVVNGDIVYSGMSSLTAPTLPDEILPGQWTKFEAPPDQTWDLRDLVVSGKAGDFVYVTLDAPVIEVAKTISLAKVAGALTLAFSIKAQENDSTFVVDFGDGTVTRFIQSGATAIAISHAYAATGVATVTIAIQSGRHWHTFDITTAAALSGGVVPPRVFLDDPTLIDFTAQAITSAAIINALLASAVAASLTSGTIGLAGGTNSPATGQGLTDATALGIAGVTVTLNP